MSSRLFVILQIVVFVCNTNAAVWPSMNECGKVNFDGFYNSGTSAELKEYPWIGRIGYTTDGEISYNCLTVLIAKRYTLSTAFCFIDEKLNQYRHVIFGGFIDKNNRTVAECDNDNNCIPEPKVFDLDEIVMHPNFNEKLRTNDIALLRLAREVTFTDYLSPICFPPKVLGNNEQRLPYVGQFLPAVGFRAHILGIKIDYKQPRFKSLVHIMSLKQCKQRFENIFGIELNDKHICGIVDSLQSLIPGFALMNFRVDNGEPRIFYLIGISLGANAPLLISNSEVFLRVASYRDWIIHNVVE